MRVTALFIISVIALAGCAQPASAQARHADCFYKKPDGTIVLHQCKNQNLRKRAKPQQQPRKKILVVPTGRELDI